MSRTRFLKFAVAAALAMSCIPSLSADILTADFVNPVNDGILDSIQMTVNNVTGELTATWIAPAGDFFNGQYAFAFNAGDPSRGTVDEQTNQNSAFLDVVTTLTNAPSFTVTEDVGGPDYDGSVAGWQAGDTIITCGNDVSVCGEFITGIYSYSQNAFVSEVNISGTLESASTAPEPAYWSLAALCLGFIVVRKRASARPN